MEGVDLARAPLLGILQRGKGKEDDVLNVDDSFGKLVHFLVPFKKDVVPVGKVNNTRKGGRLAIRFDLLDDRVWHGVRRERSSLDFLSGRQAEKLVSPLQVFSGAEHYRRGGASHHGVCWRRFIMNLAVRPKQRLAILREIQLVPVNNCVGIVSQTLLSLPGMCSATAPRGRQALSA